MLGSAGQRLRGCVNLRRARLRFSPRATVSIKVAHASL
jgi:hypothetical protein